MPIAPTLLHRLQLHRHGQLPGWLLMKACFSRHETVPHASPGWILLACPDGLEEFVAPHFRGPIPAGSLLLIPPEQMHADRSGWHAPIQIQALYLPEGLLPPAQRLLLPAAALNFFSRWCERFAAGESAVSLRQTLLDWWRQLPLQPDTAPARPDPVPKLSELAQAQGRSKAATLRAFRRRWGCTPAQLRRQDQLRQAARLILQGHSLADIALETGFWDQSHLHRHFLGVYGMSPGAFRQHNCVQDD